MGLIRDALGSALGAGGVRNGFDGPQVPFTSRQRYNNYQAADIRGGSRPSPLAQSEHFSSVEQPTPPAIRFGASDLHPVSFERDYNAYSKSQRGSPELGQIASFRPLVLPQVTYGDGQPFLRAYSSELQQYGISSADFIRAIDAINIAVVPSAGMQIFQTGANIAGWFLPGAAATGLMVGQIAAGVGGAYGHSALLNQVLSKTNLEIFVPRGLEVCIGKSKDVDNILGTGSFLSQRPAMYDASAENRVAAYGSLVAPLDLVLPVTQGGSGDNPISMLGHGLTNRANQKKADRAHKQLSRNRSGKLDKMESELDWLIVREASPGAISHWQGLLQQSDAALEQEQTQAATRH